MVLQACRNPGYLGGLSISPETVSITKEEELEYIISVDEKTNLKSDLEAEFRIDPQFVNSSDFDYIFEKADILKYSIKENQNGFNFKFTSKDSKLKFKLIPRNFFNPYEETLIVDAVTIGYGNATSILKVTPEFEIIQADNFSDYPIELGLSPETSVPPPLDTIVAKPAKDDIRRIKESEKFSVINEYNYYAKEFEETKVLEQNLLNINKVYSSIDVRQYFSGKKFSKQEFKTILHPVSYVKDIYPKLDKQKFLFPMFVEVKFETDIVKTELVTFLEKMGMLDYFCYFYIFKLQNKKISFVELKDLISKTRVKDSDLQIQENYNGQISNIKSYETNSFQKTILLKVLEKQMADLPSIYKDETLMYKIVKYKNNEIINEQYFINKFENQELIYFDTQLKYDTEYTYKISKISVLSDGSISEIDLPQYQAILKLVDSPPLPPDVAYIPYKGVDNELMINFNINSGRYSDYPIIIKDSDITVFNKILENSRYSRTEQNQNKIQFEADDAFGTFELYRLDKAPKSYADFKDAYQIETSFTSLVDNIEPNKKYYYISRVRDIHGNLSNPTKPLEIEIVNQNGTIFLLKREYSFGEETKMTYKNIKNVLQLKPNKQQMQINKELTYDPNPKAETARQVNLVLGTKETSVWNKQFLMRITSKKTGKKIDVKFKLVYSKPR